MTARSGGVNLTSFNLSSANDTIGQHMSSSTSSGPPSEFGDLSLADTRTAMAHPRRSLPGSGQIKFAAHRTPTVMGTPSRRPPTNRQAAEHGSGDGDSTESSGEEESTNGGDGSEEEITDDDEESEDETNRRRQDAVNRARRQKVFELMAAFHPTHLTPDEFWNDRALEASPASEYKKMTSLLSACIAEDPDRIRVLREIIIPPPFWRNQIVANQHIRYDRIKTEMEHNIMAVSRGISIPQVIEQLGTLYEGIDSLIRQSIRFRLTDKVADLVSILVDALIVMTDDEDKSANVRGMPHYVGNAWQHEHRPALAFLAERGNPGKFIEILRHIRVNYRPSFRAQDDRIRRINIRLQLILRDIAADANFPPQELSRYASVILSFRSNLVDPI